MEKLYKVKRSDSPQKLFRILKPSIFWTKKSARGLDWYTGYQHKFMSINSIRRYSSTWCRREKSWSRHQKLQEDWIGYKDIGYYFIKSINLFKLGATRCHGTRIARGVPLPVYINLDLYSGF